MTEQKKFQKQGLVMSRLPDERGSVLLTTLIILLLLTLIGISGINTASTDLQITGNYRVQQENIVLGEAAANYAMTMIEDALDENPMGRDWVDGKAWEGVYLVEDLQAEGDKYFKEGSDYDPYLHSVVNAIDVEAVLNDWGSIGSLSPEEVSFLSDAEYLAFIQIEDGAELGERMTSAVVIARAQRNGANVVLEKSILYSD